MQPRIVQGERRQRDFEWSPIAGAECKLDPKVGLRLLGGEQKLLDLGILDGDLQRRLEPRLSLARAVECSLIEEVLRGVGEPLQVLAFMAVA